MMIRREIVLRLGTSLHRRLLIDNVPSSLEASKLSYLPLVAPNA